MSIFLTKDSKVIVQGMTGSEGTKHTTRMLASGTNIVGGVNPRKAGETVDVEGSQVPVFGSVADSIGKTGADVSVIFVPPKFTKDAVMEAIEAGMPLVVVITEGVPVHDTAAFFAAARSSASPPISPIITIATVSSSASKASRASMCVVPMIGSPPIPIAVEKPKSLSSYIIW
jgi:succinyl-CoA synthetase alpha subunit